MYCFTSAALPEWGFAVDSLSSAATSLCPPKRIAGGKKAASFAALGGWYFLPTQVVIARIAVNRWTPCICKQTVIPAGDGIARVRRESKGRGGKTVTTITGVPLADAQGAGHDVEKTLWHRWGVERRDH